MLKLLWTRFYLGSIYFKKQLLRYQYTLWVCSLRIGNTWHFSRVHTVMTHFNVIEILLCSLMSCHISNIYELLILFYTSSSFLCPSFHPGKTNPVKIFRPFLGGYFSNLCIWKISIFNLNTPILVPESHCLLFTSNHKNICGLSLSFFPTCLQDPASSTGSEADSDTREGEPVTINYKPSPLQMKIGEPELPFLSKAPDIIMIDLHR